MGGWHPWKGIEGLPRETWALATVAFVNRAGTMVLPFLVLYLTEGSGWTPSAAGRVLALYGLVALVAAPLGGRITDRFGPAMVMFVSLTASAVAFALFPFAHSPTRVVVATVLLALVAEAFRPAALTAIGDFSPPERMRSAYALQRLAVNLGMSIGPAVGGVLAEANRFDWLFWLDGGTSLAAAFLLWRWIPLRRARTDEHAHLAPRGAYRDWRLIGLLLSLLPIQIVFFQHQSSMPLYLVRDLSLRESFFGLLFAINTLIIVFCEVPINGWLSGWSNRRSMVVGTTLIAVGFGAMALARTPITVAVTVVIWTLGEMILFPGMNAAVAELAPAGRRGDYMGAYAFGFGIALTVGPWLGTQLYERFGGVVLWAAMLGAGLLSAALLGVVGRRREGGVSRP